jgi:hypothetical protein
VYSVHRNHIEWLCGITPPHTKSHQLRTIKERGHINFVPWLYVVTSTPYPEWMCTVQTVVLILPCISCIRKMHFWIGNKILLNSLCWLGLGRNCMPSSLQAGGAGPWLESQTQKLCIKFFKDKLVGRYLWQELLYFQFNRIFSKCKEQLASEAPPEVSRIWTYVLCVTICACHRCRWYRWWTLTCEYLRKFSKNSKRS